jgi:hypothetical protein
VRFEFPSQISQTRGDVGLATHVFSNSKFGRVGETQCQCGPQKGINEPVFGPTGSLGFGIL